MFNKHKKKYDGHLLFNLKIRTREMQSNEEVPTRKVI